MSRSPSLRAATLAASLLGTVAVYLMALSGTAPTATARTLPVPPAPSAATSHHVTPVSALDVTATNYVLDLHLKGAVHAGRVRLTLHNLGSVDHETALLRLRPQVTVAQFRAALGKGGDGAALALTVPAGGAAAVAPGGTQVTWQILAAGSYLAVCLVTGPDGMSHLSMGMFAAFHVAGAVPTTRQPGGRLFTVAPRHTIVAHDMTFGLPAGFTGHGLYRFVDTDKEDSHEWQFLRLAPGKHKADFVAWLTRRGIPPFSTAGGVAPVVPGAATLARVDLAPGTYLLTCFVPDDKAPHLPHALMGMVVELTIH